MEFYTMRFTITALTASLMVSTAAFAANDSMKSAATAAPEAGAVTLSGTVDKLVDKDTFVLRDASGNRIDVNTASPLAVKEGDVVSVKGQKSPETMGMGVEISDAFVVAGAASASKGSPMSSAKTDDSRKQAKSESVAESANAGLSNIENLPEEGSVNLSGVVSRVSGSDSFTLSDSNGKSINVQTASAADVKQGDTVSVNGQIGDRLLGFGRQIEDAKVMIIGAK
jgi:uncharacterized protein YdeI (BOF family)